MKKLFVLVVSALFIVAIGSYASETVKGAKKDYAEFKKEMSEQLDAVEKKIAELKEQASQKGGETKEKTVKELEETRDKLKVELAQMQDDGKQGWKKFKKNLATGIESLNAKVQKALKD